MPISGPDLHCYGAIEVLFDPHDGVANAILVLNLLTQFTCPLAHSGIGNHVRDRIRQIFTG